MLSGLKQLLLFSGVLLENMILERNNFFGHLLHLQCLVELVLLHKVFLSWIAFSFMTGPRVLSRNLFFIFSPNMAHFWYLLSIECVCFVAISFVLIQRFSRYWWWIFNARCLRFIMVSVHNLHLMITTIHKWNALPLIILLRLASKLVGHSNYLILFIIVFLGGSSPPLVF